MATPYRIGIIGAGKPWKTDGATGFGMSHQHMEGYTKSGRCELACIADLVEENGKAFAERHGKSAALYSDYKEMMEKEKPDIVSVCLWPHLHAKVVLDLVPLGPKAIHCEKPMDLHWQGALKMHEACEKAGIQLTFNHQRRFTDPLLEARKLLDAKALGQITRIEGGWSNFMDNGTHILDTFFYFNDDIPAQWVMAQVDGRGSRKVFGAWQEGQGLLTFGFENGVRGTYISGKGQQDFNALIRVVGDKGQLEVRDQSEAWLYHLDYEKGGGWKPIATKGSFHDNEAIHRAMADLVAALDEKRRPLLSSHHAIQSTQVIFGAYESARRRGRVDFPLEPGPSALEAMIEAKEIPTDPS